MQNSVKKLSNQKSQVVTAGTGLPDQGEKDSGTRQPVQASQKQTDRTRTEQPREDRQERKASTGKSEQDTEPRLEMPEQGHHN
jgi:hypothetical protein